ncbi:MAG: molybdopterin-dependent oxidoreductase [Firmicutes bacterium]|nr:molybdopterin-dependent oxidoreductase [Bacillota bacterium]
MAQPAIKSGIREDVWIPTVCYMCFNGCALLAHRVNGVVVKVEGNPDSPHSNGKCCAKGNAAVMGLYNPNRITTPLKRTNPEKGLGVDPQFIPISWEEALSVTAARLKEIRDRDPRRLLFTSFDISTGPFGEAFAGAFGTHNVTSGPAGYFCGNGVHPITWMNHGTFYAEPDVDHCKYLILIGSQTGAAVHINPLGMGPRMAESRLKGMKLVVVDPMCSHMASKANDWIPIRPGTDGAFALGMLDVLLNELGIYDAPFIKQHTNGAYLVGPDGKYVRHPETGKPLVWDTAINTPLEFDDPKVIDPAIGGRFEVEGVQAAPGFQLLKEHVRAYPPERVEEITTIPAATIRRIAGEYGEAASIGSKIVIDGVELPYRPAHVDWGRGPSSHKHAMANGVAIQLLNTVIGAVDVPGGHLGISGSGPDWEPYVGPDGLLAPSKDICVFWQPYPPRKAKKPELYEVPELFPLAVYSRSMLPENLLHPERYGLDYPIEAMIQSRNNLMMQAAAPELMAKVFSRIPFTVSFANAVESTTELADIVFPDTHFLERLDPFANPIRRSMLANCEHWYWMVRQPVSDPPPGVRHWVSVLYDLAERIGILPEYHRMINRLLKLKEPYQLDPERTGYSYEDLMDRWCRSRLGPDYSLEHHMDTGVYKEPKDVRHVYQRSFLKCRIPLYHEFFIKAGEDVRRVTAEMGIKDWETEDYEALPNWRPCPAYEEKGAHNLFLINYKVPYHAQSYTYDNVWLDDLTQGYPDARSVLINTDTAGRMGIADGDDVVIESTNGYRSRAIARVVETIHPEVAAIMGTQGHWVKGQPMARGKGVHWNAMLVYDTKRIDKVSAALDACVKVKVEKISP